MVFCQSAFYPHRLTQPTKSSAVKQLDSLRGPIVKMPKLAYDSQSDFNFVFGLVVPNVSPLSDTSRG